MLGWIVRILFVIAGFVTSLFVARDELNFPVIQTVVAVILFTFIIAIIAFWPMFLKWIKENMKKNKME